MDSWYLSNFYCLPGRAGGSLFVLARVRCFGARCGKLQQRLARIIWSGPFLCAESWDLGGYTGRCYEFPAFPTRNGKPKTPLGLWWLLEEPQITRTLVIFLGRFVLPVEGQDFVRQLTNYAER